VPPLGATSIPSQMATVTIVLSGSPSIPSDLWGLTTMRTGFCVMILITCKLVTRYQLTSTRSLNETKLRHNLKLLKDANLPNSTIKLAIHLFVFNNIHFCSLWFSTSSTKRICLLSHRDTFHHHTLIDRTLFFINMMNTQERIATSWGRAPKS